MAAVFAARAGAETLIIERTVEGGRKVLISGGGRCNILPSDVDASRFVTDASKNSLKKILLGWPLKEQISFFEKELQLPLEREAETGKLFPASQRARDVRDGLLAEARARGAKLYAQALVTGIAPKDGKWAVDIADAPSIVVDAVIVATGGLSVPKTGSDGSGIAFARKLGVLVNPTYAALTPVLAETPLFNALAGITLRVRITARDGEREATAEDAFLFTHRGYSGPAVLDVSHVLVRARDEGRRDARLLVRWTEIPEEEWTRRLGNAQAGTVHSVLRRELPERLAEALCRHAAVEPSRTLPQLCKDERRRLLDVLLRCELPWSAHEGYRVAEVTGGGVDLAEIDHKTMESRKHPGLFFCGEVLDVFGPIGGYNFLWAWVTGRAAGVGAARR
ncbi:MAG: aminoacetone oxidase family FAD-binding enzyme [Bacteroidetes bacterium]|nr:aminoacetone oxidase family FAD-binding enzyme [Bacteroidota bacterium]